MTVDKSNQTLAEAVGEPFTFSTGIVIAHLMQPLKDVMYQVNKAEKEAKRKDKNAFAISLMKRGSETRMIKYSFDKKYAQLQALKTIIELFNKDQNSRSFVYNLSQILLKLMQDATKEPNREMIKSLIRQTVHHQRIAEEDEVMEHIQTLYEHVDTKTLMNTLDVIGFLSGKIIIQPKKKEVSDNDVQNQSH